MHLTPIQAGSNSETSQFFVKGKALLGAEKEGYLHRQAFFRAASFSIVFNIIGKIILWNGATANQ